MMLYRLLQVILIWVVFLVGMPAVAQDINQSERSRVDPRIATESVTALEALLKLREAQIKALIEDAARRERDWAEYSKPLWSPSDQSDASAK